ncbi:cytochrome P450 [Suillus clintonianus]|uniref:cytochrome P450 n=1 Tax=Suillus clintonianus TaxID=1904413 RepID=UPI001B86AEC1|nr:cytochrome P450 [Suillus clintonianus]KAG2131395.1 cytochrome P450 [Suillus clintonianus]
MSSDWRDVCIGALICATLVGAVRCGMERRKMLPLPPGPRAIPFIGNVRGIDINAPWLAYTEWGKRYGDIVYSHLLGQQIIVINSEKVAIELLEKRSHNYSNRPTLPTSALFGLDFNTVLIEYGARWRRQRRVFHQAFRAEAALSYRPMQQRKAQQLIRDMLDTPEEFIKHVHTYSSSLIMSALYDYETERDDALVELIWKSLKLAVQELRPEVAALFTAFPIFLRLPAWFPGMSIKRKATQSREWVREWMNDPFQLALKRTAEGTAQLSMVSNALRRIDGKNSSGEMTIIKESAATAFGAASETTSGVLQVFILAMVLFPEIQVKAHTLIDAVVGASRLPTFEDRSSLQYIDAILRETLRWHPILPLSTPHASVDSDVYEGFYIPKGAAIVPNVWAMSQNEHKYPNPSQFSPERFLNADGSLNDDTVNIAYGFGRRICVGRHLADASLWIAISCLLTTFAFSKRTGANGDAVDFEVEWSSGVAIHPLPFPCSITPRLRKVDI